MRTGDERQCLCLSPRAVSTRDRCQHLLAISIQHRNPTKVLLGSLSAIRCALTARIKSKVSRVDTVRHGITADIAAGLVRGERTEYGRG